MFISNCCCVYFDCHGNIERYFPYFHTPLGFSKGNWTIRDSSRAASKFIVQQVVEDNKYLLGLAQCQMLCLALWKRRWMSYLVLLTREIWGTLYISIQCNKWCDNLCTRCCVLKRDVKRASKETVLKLFEYCPGVTPKNGEERRLGGNLSSFISYFPIST